METDFARVLKGLTYCIDVDGDCSSCPYHTSETCGMDLKKDAFRLIKYFVDKDNSVDRYHQALKYLWGMDIADLEKYFPEHGTGRTQDDFIISIILSEEPGHVIAMVDQYRSDKRKRKDDWERDLVFDVCKEIGVYKLLEIAEEIRKG